MVTAPNGMAAAPATAALDPNAAAGKPVTAAPPRAERRSGNYQRRREGPGTPRYNLMLSLGGLY
jgi:hypothetical protein